MCVFELRRGFARQVCNIFKRLKLGNDGIALDKRASCSLAYYLRTYIQTHMCAYLSQVTFKFDVIRVDPLWILKEEELMQIGKQLIAMKSLIRFVCDKSRRSIQLIYQLSPWNKIADIRHAAWHFLVAPFIGSVR